jgi:hypothetical protein
VPLRSRCKQSLACPPRRSTTKVGFRVVADITDIRFRPKLNVWFRQKLTTAPQTRATADSLKTSSAKHREWPDCEFAAKPGQRCSGVISRAPTETPLRSPTGVPSFNYDRAETIASIERLKQIEKNLKATVIIQHDPRDTDKLPAFPAVAK